MADGADNFEIKPLITEFPGYNSARDKTNIADGYLIRGSQNVYKKLSGTIAVRPGLLRRGAADATLAGVDSSWEWNTWDGRCLPLRISNGNLQVESDILTSGTYVWYTLLSSLTKTRWVFDAWWDNTAKKDVALMVDGTSALRNWSGAIALFVSYAPTVITLDRNVTTAGFSASGSIVINGVTYTYSGRSGSTLTGTSDASAAVANDVALEAVGSNSNTPASGFLADFLRVINNRVWVGSYSSRLVYGSKTSSYTDYSQNTPRVPGNGELITMDNVGKGIGVRNGNPWFSAGTSDWYEISFSQITVGTTLSEQSKVDKKPAAMLQAALGHEFIDMVGDDLVCLTQDKQLRIIGQFTNQFSTKFLSLSTAIKDELSDETFTGGHVRAVGDFIHITAPLSGRDYMYEVREGMNKEGAIEGERFWHPPQVRNVARFAVISGVLYGHSNANPQIYQIWDTMQWHDDDPTDSGLGYDAIAFFNYRNHGRRMGMTSFDRAYFEGYVTQGTSLSANFYQNYQGSEAIQFVTINSPTSPAAFQSGDISPSIGDASLGDNPLGQGLSLAANDQERLPKFRKFTDVNPVDCYEYAIAVFSTELDSRWELLALGTNASESSNYPVQLRG